MNKKINPVLFPGINASLMYDNELKKIKIKNEDKKEIIKERVIEFTGISWEKIESKYRDRPIVKARQLFHYFMREYTTYGLSEIAIFTKNDHSLLYNSFKSVSDQKDVDKHYRTDFESLQMNILFSFRLFLNKENKENVV
jgi:chromosomal replication initiation ATPase DnaA